MHFHDTQAKRTLKAQKLQEELASGKLEQVVSKLKPNLFLLRLNKYTTGYSCSLMLLLSIQGLLLVFMPFSNLKIFLAPAYSVSHSRISSIFFQIRVVLFSPYGQKFCVIIILAKVNDTAFWVRKTCFPCSNFVHVLKSFFCF